MKTTKCKYLIRKIRPVVACSIIPVMILSGISQKNKQIEKKNFYCEYCGHKFPTVLMLTNTQCVRHPNGINKGNHILYEGTVKKEYTCKYCGKKFSSILFMTGGQCVNHPKGKNKGNHSPAL